MNKSSNTVTVKNGAQSTSSSVTLLTPGTERTNPSLSRPNASAVVDKHVWTKEESEMLLDMYEANRDNFRNPGIRKIGVWANIAKIINLKFGSEFSAQQCHQKLRNFKNDFHKVMMLEKKDCRHFERLHRLFLQSAAKPSQSPAALKRKLTQLAGSKPGNASGPSNQKKLCTTFSSSPSCSILPGLDQSKQENTTSANSFTEGSSTENRKIVQTNKHNGASKFSSNIAYLEQSSAPLPSSVVTFPVELPSYQGQSKAAATHKKQLSSSFSPNSTDVSAGGIKEPVVCCPKVDDQKQKMDRSASNLVNKPPQEIILDKSDIETILKNGEAEKGKNGLPVPLYYFSNKNPNKVLVGQGQDAFVERNVSQNQSISQARSQNGAFGRNSKKTPLEVFKTLFDTSSNRKSNKPVNIDKKHTCITENNQRSRAESTKQTTTGDISKLVETIDKWRNESLEREAARIIREKERDNRLEEMHRENVNLTSRFIDIFETLLARMNSSST